jgi:hypothetical protein
MSEWLHGDVRLFNADLAKAVGVNEAIMIHQIHHWLRINKEQGRNYEDGRYWTYNTLEAWSERDFKFWSKSTIQRVLGSLKAKGLVLTAIHNKKGYDRTTWYSLDYDALEILEAENKGMTTSPGQSDHMDDSGDNGPEIGQKPPDVVGEGGVTTSCGQSDHMSTQPDHNHVVNLTTTIPETSTERTTETKGKGKGRPEPVPFEETLTVLNSPTVVRYLVVDQPAENADRTTDLFTVASSQGDGSLKFPDNADTREAFSMIGEALTARGLPVDPLHIAAVVIQAYSGYEENGKGHRMINYMVRHNCGLTCRPLIRYTDKRGTSIIDETMESTNIPDLAEYIRDRVMTPPTVAELEERNALAAKFEAADEMVGTPWSFGATEKAVAAQ